MIKSLIVTNERSETLVMELAYPAKSGYAITSIEGLGPVKNNIALIDRVNLNGSYFNSSRSTERNIVIDIRFVDKLVPVLSSDDSLKTEVLTKSPKPIVDDIIGSEFETTIIPIPPPIVIPPTLEELRQDLYRYFPANESVRLQIVTDSRDVYTIGYVETHEPDIFSDESSTTISLICPNSNLYSSLNLSVPFSSVESNFEFPFSNEDLEEPLIIFSTFATTGIKTVVYKGDSKTGFLIHIHVRGTVENIRVENAVTFDGIELNTDKITDIVGSALADGDDIWISSVKGNKYAKLRRGSSEYNILACLGRHPYWFELKKGDNSFSYTADDGIENVDFEIISDVLYDGV